jgi:hypothetical protein
MLVTVGRLISDKRNRFVALSVPDSARLVALDVKRVALERL